METINRLRAFIHIESASGIILLMAAALALVLANAPVHLYYHSFFNQPIQLTIAGWHNSITLLAVINDGLMALFFLLVSLEIKREFLIGALNSKKKFLLPGIAAAGGMLCPALLFFLVIYPQQKYYPGWAIPTATDIAFSLGILSLLGRSIPSTLKTFLMALAILDDLGAIIIIAIFYTHHIQFIYLALAIVITTLLVFINYYGCRRLWFYGVMGFCLWLCLINAGIHGTIAGVITGFAIPLKCNKSLERQLHPWVAYGILPLFALANSGLVLTHLHLKALLHPLTLGIACGLLFGKQLGVFSASWLAVKLKIAQLPDKTNWYQFYGVACLCGIGFTMSLFIGTLAFGAHSESSMELIRLGVFSSSCLAGISGYIILRLKKDLL